MTEDIRHWIYPGEFKYCGRCGWHLVPSGAMLCRGCDPPKMVKVEYSDGTCEFRYEDDARPPATVTHELLMADAVRLSHSRRADGVPPMSWMSRSHS